ncbi:DUF2855 family protein, partial [uncultured Kiloniella sp.]|uniref:DUF2855 family protein n=1 Tax=uncultured Kiloniella sp. TaxID=1133091 RepID=UPI00262B81DF
SFVLYDYLIFNQLFNATQIIIGSVSSKTGLGLAKMLSDDPAITAKIVGVTSAGNQPFVNALGCCDQVVLYGDEHAIDQTLTSAYVDMSGNAELTTALHQHLQNNNYYAISFLLRFLAIFPWCCLLSSRHSII